MRLGIKRTPISVKYSVAIEKYELKINNVIYLINYTHTNIKIG